MRKIAYILSVVLLTACASETSKSVQQEETIPKTIEGRKIDIHPSQKQEKIEQLKETKKDAVPVERKIKKSNTEPKTEQNSGIKSKEKFKAISSAEKSISSDKEHLKVGKKVTDAYLSELSKQKLQQIYDISSLVHQDGTQQEMRQYALKYANRLFIKPEKNISDKLNNLSDIKADSIKIDRVRLIDLTDNRDNGQIGRYTFNANYYRNGRVIYRQKHVAEIFFEITELNFDGQIHQTVKSRIKKIY